MFQLCNNGAISALEVDRELKISMTNTTGIIQTEKPCYNLFSYHRVPNCSVVYTQNVHCTDHSALRRQQPNVQDLPWEGLVMARPWLLWSRCAIFISGSRQAFRALMVLVGGFPDDKWGEPCKVKGWAYKSFQYSQTLTKTNVYVYSCKFWSFSSIQNVVWSCGLMDSCKSSGISSSSMICKWTLSLL